MLRFSKLRMVLIVSAILLPWTLAAQDDPNETPLGDVARGLRKRTLPSLPVIDDDNFSKVMEQVESQRVGGSTVRFVMPAESKSFQVSQTDVTCSMSFSANAKALLSSQYAEMKLPATELLKLEGPATMEGQALNVSVTNGTEWHVSEVAVALTVVKKNGLENGASEYGEAKMYPPPDPSQESALRPKKKPDTTVIYRMRAAAGPSATTVFSTPLELSLEAGDEWHWAIVEAKGYPPQRYSAGGSQLASGVGPSIVVPSSLKQFDAPASADLRHDPQ